MSGPLAGLAASVRDINAPMANKADDFKNVRRESSSDPKGDFIARQVTGNDITVEPNKFIFADESGRYARPNTTFMKSLSFICALAIASAGQLLALNEIPNEYRTGPFALGCQA